jgi:hypothetical protein
MLSLITSCNSFIASGYINYIKPDIPKRTAYVSLDQNLFNSIEEYDGGAELKLLTHMNAESWANSWLMHISHETTPFFDEHYYRDYLNMLSVSASYTSKEYFYLGFYPKDSPGYDGPKYIGVFKLMHKQRIFDTIMIIENPYHLDDDSNLVNFKYIVTHMSDSAHVFFKFSGLKKPEQMRYYLAWMHM